MKTLTLTLAFSLFLPFQSEMAKDEGKVEGVEKSWSTPAELNVPESVLYDKKRKTLFVSNISGKPTEKNGEGYIAKLALDGEIEEQKWVEGLEAPKGMGIHDGTLYVSDIDRLVAIDIKNAEISETYEKERAKFLNDITIGPEGTVFVSDMNDQRIYTLEADGLNTWKKGEILEKVNGLFWHKGTLYAGTGNKILAIDPNDRSATTVVEGTPAVDGLIAGVHNGFLFSDWEGRVFFAEHGGEPKTLSDTREQEQNAADIGYHPKKEEVLVPTFFDNRVVAYKLQKGQGSD